MVVTATYSDETTSVVTATYLPANGTTLSEVGTVTVTASYTENGVTKTATTTVTVSYPAYAVGDVETLGGEDFYVIEASDASTSTVKLLAKYNVITTSGEGQYTQSTSANTLAFDDDSNDYSDENFQIKAHVNAYKTEVEKRMNGGTTGPKTIQEARLMTGTATGTWNGDYTVWTYTSGTGEVGALLDAN